MNEYQRFPGKGRIDIKERNYSYAGKLSGFRKSRFKY